MAIISENDRYLGFDRFIILEFFNAYELKRKIF